MEDGIVVLLSGPGEATAERRGKTFAIVGEPYGGVAILLDGKRLTSYSHQFGGFVYGSGPDGAPLHVYSHISVSR
jgi:hypothetical protein